MNVHPKLAASTIAGLFVAVVMLGIQQYAPSYAPNADLASAITAFVSAIAGYFTSSP